MPNPSHYTLVTFDVPGASYTTLTGINDKGQIVGTIPNPDTPAFLGYYVGFVDDKGTITNLIGPAYKGNTPTDINDRGQISLVSTNQSGPQSSLFGDGIPVSSLPIPITTGLNNELDSVGLYPNGQGVFYSSESKTSTPIEVPGSTQTRPLDINDRDEFVGSYRDASGNLHGFLFAHDRFQFINYPGATATLAEAVNDRGVIVGEYDNHGFIDNHGKLTTLDFPGAISTQISGINDKNQIVGTYQDTNHVTHGFIGYLNDHPGELAGVLPQS
jgi:uncharacterized membrane protein